MPIMNEKSSVRPERRNRIARAHTPSTMRVLWRAIRVAFQCERVRRDLALSERFLRKAESDQAGIANSA